MHPYPSLLSTPHLKIVTLTGGSHKYLTEYWYGRQTREREVEVDSKGKNEQEILLLHTMHACMGYCISLFITLSVANNSTKDL
jgi:hypothetical protein